MILSNPDRNYWIDRDTNNLMIGYVWNKWMVNGPLSNKF